MLSERGRRKLLDILDNARLAQSWVADMTAAEFSKDTKTFYAVTRALEIVSEASRSLDAATKTRLSFLPWTDIAGAGNIYRHGYDDVDARIIWSTVRSALPPLLAAVNAELRDQL